MADATGQWGTISFAIPDYLEGVRDAVNDFADLLITFLEIANAVLEFAKAFIRGFLDPLVAIIEAIIDEILSLLRDLRQIGLYITGDWALLGWPPEDLRGGFAAYERRMIARLSDRTDPTRPDVSSATKVLGFFSYISVDPSEFERLVNFILSIIRMFGLSFFADTSGLPIPSIQSTSYGPDAVNVFNFGSMLDVLGSFNSAPTHARVTWVARPASLKSPLNPIPVVGPSGYLVTVSTIKEGLQLRYSRAKGNTPLNYADGDAGRLVGQREYGSVLDVNGQPIVLHGGAEMLIFKGSPFEFNRQINTSTQAPKHGVAQVFGMVDPASNEIVPLEDLGVVQGGLGGVGTPGDGLGSNFFLQRTFLMSSNVATAQWFAGEYNMTLGIDDMPRAAHWERQPDGTLKRVDDGPASTYYVRVWAVGKQVAEGRAFPQWNFNASTFRSQVFKSGQPFIVDLDSGRQSISLPSEPRQLTFANANTKDYLKALETALLILVLARADLPLVEELLDAKTAEILQQYRDGLRPGDGFALRATGLEDARTLFQLMFPDPTVLEQAGRTPQQWRRDLQATIRQFALDIYERTGPMPGMEATVVRATENLRTVSWPDLLSIDSSVGADTYSSEVNKRTSGVASLPLIDALQHDDVIGCQEFGLAPNIHSMGLSPSDVDGLYYAVRNGPLLLRGRKSEYPVWEMSPMNVTYLEEDPKKVAVLTQAASGPLKVIYQTFTDKDGKLSIPNDWRVYLEDVSGASRVTTAGDMTPVFYMGSTQILRQVRASDSLGAASTWPGVLYLRDLIRRYDSGVLYSEAALVLRVATAAFSRSPQDGEWIAIRLFDALPDLEDFLNALENWVKSLAEAIQSMATAIVKYIEFLQGIISDLQQLIRRINAMIQSLLSFAFLLPQFSGLLLASDGTDGLLADLVAATNKPSDSPRSYGGGVAVVVPLAPGFIFDIIQLAAGENPDPNAMTSLTQPPEAIGIEQVEPSTAPSSDEPDVL